MNAPSSPAPKDREYPDEISLFELWEILRRRRLTILVVFLGVALAGTVFAMTRTPVYAVTALIEIGVPATPSEDEERPNTLEPLNAVVDRLNAILLPEAADEAGAVAATARLDSQEASLIEIQADATAGSADAVTAAMRSALEALAEQHQLRHDTSLAEANRRIEELSSLQNAYADASSAAEAAMDENELQRLTPDGIAMLESARLFLRGGLLSGRTEIEARLADLEAAVEASQPTTVIQAPERSDQPQDQRQGLVISLSVILGLMLGVFAAFITEFIANARVYRQQMDADQTP